MFARSPMLVRLMVAGFLISPAAHADPPVGEATTQPEAQQGQAMRTAGWFALGGAVVALTGSAVLFGLSQDRPAADATPGQVADRNDSIRREHGAAEILLVGAAVSAAAGVSVILLAPTQKASPHVAIGIGTLVVGTNF